MERWEAAQAKRLVWPMIHLGIPGQHCVGKVHQVGIVRLAVVAPDVGKGIAPAVGAHGVAVEYKVPQVCPVLHFVVEHRAINRLRPAVNVQNPRVALVGIKVFGQQHPAFNLPPLAL